MKSGKTLTTFLISEAIRESNNIEDVWGEEEVAQSLIAWHYLVEQEMLTLEVLLELHRLVMLNLLPEGRGQRGQLRLHNVTVGGRLCPHYRDVPTLVGDWLNLMRRENLPELTPTYTHIEFEHIHPFIDGNGRTGRMLMWWHARKIGIEPQIIRFGERFKYYDWF
jgi:Fic family protein